MREIAVLILLSGSLSAGDWDMEREAKQQYPELRASVEKLLKARLDPPSSLQVCDPETYAREFRKHLNAAEQRPWLEAETWLRRKLGLLKEKENLTERLVQAARVGGFYDEKTNKIYLVRRRAELAMGLEQSMLRVGLTHEIVHAHRAQQRLYEARPARSGIGDDAGNAFKALAEGDATLIGIATLSSSPDGWSKSLKNSARGFVERGEPTGALDEDAERFFSVFPYRAGSILASHVYLRGGMEALARAFRSPPVSTEQILHPEKYLGPKPDKPTRFAGGDLTPVLGEGWKVVSEGVLGELAMRVVFRSTLGDERATQVAAGWDGSLVRIYRKEGEPALLAMMTTWDTSRDALEFGQAWCDWAGQRDGKKTFDVKNEMWGIGELRSLRPADGVVVTVRRGPDLVVLDGVPKGMETKLLVALWTTRFVRERAKR